jgi:hypothetical protein
MTRVRATDADPIAPALTEVIERVFGTVAGIRPAALQVLQAERDGAETSAELEQQVRALLGAPGQFAVGLGLIVAPRAGNDFRRRLHWWQVDPAADRLVALDPDLRSSSLGFYDYTAADWFAVPLRTGRRHVVGPYVDVHGTGRYVLTLTEPVVSDGEFLGVVGADVPVPRFESHLLRVLASVDAPFVVVNDEDRVVLSTSPGAMVGDRLAADTGPAAPVPDVPWRVLLVRETGPLPAAGSGQRGMRTPGVLPSRPMTP